ncbi:Gfo/Idh/MocA family protein [Sporolactobacillus putidus]|uniref:Dehydrogenase n=1 Tax=Sporolactobacillus putidus TaxID=492735 RepID=A0A917S7K1_9BACL|nr:Gfo/Idh/MocA family oxidoreductase [Sporolactobacillus putidus]GGL62289.1 dehydrogenase [Sporolactobacillus putidus]
MLKIGIIGIGSIARKAYLPIYAGLSGVECHFCTRNRETLEQIQASYRWTHFYDDLDRLIESGVEAVFIHAATTAHPMIIEKLLNKGISIYTDKPIADHYETAKRLTEIAENKKVLLMTGFNRRFAPYNLEVSSVPEKSMIVYQKNRVNDPKDIRTFIFDDFIHVVDTVRFLLASPIDTMTVHATKNREGFYTELTVVFHAGGRLAVAIMSRKSGASQEFLQVMSPQSEYVVRDLSSIESIQGTAKTIKHFGDWTPMLHKRGFEQIVEAFLKAVAEGGDEPIAKRDALETHRICEKIVQTIELGNNEK